MVNRVRLNEKAVRDAVPAEGKDYQIFNTEARGFSTNSLWSVASDIEPGYLVRVLPDWYLHDQSVLWLIYPKSNVLTPKVRCFMDFLISRLGIAKLTSKQFA